MIAPELKEQLVQDLMTKYRAEAVEKLVSRLDGVSSADVVMALPNVIAEVIQAVTGLRGQALVDKYDVEAYEIADGTWVRNTISHALYRLLNELRVVAAAAAHDKAKKKVDGDDQ